MKKNNLNKICINFETGNEVEDVMISLDNEKIIIENENLINRLKSKDTDPIFQKYPLLLELQKKLGFNVYAEYVVLPQFEDNKKSHKVGNVYGDGLILTFDRHIMDSGVYSYLGFGFYDHSLDNRLVSTKEDEYNIFHKIKNKDFYYKYSCNIVQELSKHYRKEENKFEEVRKVLGV